MVGVMSHALSYYTTVGIFWEICAKFERLCEYSNKLPSVFLGECLFVDVRIPWHWIRYRKSIYTSVKKLHLIGSLYHAGIIWIYERKKLLYHPDWWKWQQSRWITLSWNILLWMCGILTVQVLTSLWGW